MKPTVQWLEYNFDTFNVKYFEGKLPKPKFSLFCKEGDLGNYTPQAEYNTITRKVTKLTGPGCFPLQANIREARGTLRPPSSTR